MGSSSYGLQFTLASALVRSPGRCERCKRHFHPSKLDAHHTIPRKSGGPDTYGNLEALCDACHPIRERETAEATRLLASYQPAPSARRPKLSGALRDAIKNYKG